MKKFATILTSAVLCSGCATITQGTTEALYVTSDPSNANVKLSTGQQGRTPATFEVSKKKGFMVTISKDGYQDANVQVVSSIGGTSGMATAGNVIAGGGIGLIVDAASGANKELTPNPINVVLEPVDP